MLRVLPWITDGATNFLEGFLASRRGLPTKVFEFGLGNSTLFFLSRGCIVTGVDHDSKWFNAVTNAANCFEYSNHNLKLANRPYSDSFQNNGYEIISIDGRDRTDCLRRVVNLGVPDTSILLLDNTERINGHEGRYSEYSQLLEVMSVLHFEQPYLEGLGPEISSFPDRSGNRVNHRWITTIAFNESVSYTSLGKKI